MLRMTQVKVGMMTASGPCYGWMIDHSPGSLEPQYGLLAYSGPAADLAAATASDRRLASQTVRTGRGADGALRGFEVS